MLLTRQHHENWEGHVRVTTRHHQCDDTQRVTLSNAGAELNILKAALEAALVGQGSFWLIGSEIGVCVRRVGLAWSCDVRGQATLPTLALIQLPAGFLFILTVVRWRRQIGHPSQVAEMAGRVDLHPATNLYIPLAI